jgi:hypothetical protein
MLKRLIEVRNPRDMDQLLGHVHGRVYEISKVVHREADRCLDIPTTVVDHETRVKKRGLILTRWVPRVHKATLTVANVIDYTVDDRADIDGGDINTIEYQDGAVVIRGAFPVTWTIKVSSLYLRLDIANKPLEPD